jgi:hypothetical protein
MRSCGDLLPAGAAHSNPIALVNEAWLNLSRNAGTRRRVGGSLFFIALVHNTLDTSSWEVGP